MNTEGQPNQLLIEAIRLAWEREAVGVAQFGLEPVLAGIQSVASGWAVPIVSGIPTGSAYELARTIDRLQEIVESESEQSVTLYLDPFRGASAANAKKAS